MSLLQKYTGLVLMFSLYEKTQAKIHATPSMAWNRHEESFARLEKFVHELEEGKDVENEFAEHYMFLQEELKKQFLEGFTQEIFVEAADATLNEQLHQAIEEHNVPHVAAWLHIGSQLFMSGLNFQARSPQYHTPLSHAVKKLHFDIALLLLKNGAPIASFFNLGQSLLSVAVQHGAVALVDWLLTQGLTPKRNLFASLSEPMPIYLAIEGGHLEVVKLLVLKHGAKLNAQGDGVVIGSTASFKSPLRYALECGKEEIARFLFNEIKKDSKLLPEGLNHLFHYAPIELLKEFVADKTLSLQSKFATPILTRIAQKKLLRLRFSGELLLQSLLENSTQELERLSLIKQTILQMLMLDYLEPDVETEPCYLDQSLLTQLAIKDEKSPLSDLAKNLLHSLNINTRQGRVFVGYRFLTEAQSYAINNNDGGMFTQGIEFITQVLQALDAFYYPQQRWPDATLINEVIERLYNEIPSSPVHDVDNEVLFSDGSKQFQAMAGSAVFSALNPGLPSGGTPAEAVSWYLPIVPIIAQAMANAGMQNPQFPESKAIALLKEFAALSPATICKRIAALPVNNQAVGFALDVPGHFIPACVYPEKEHWVYSIMCRVFLQPLETYSGAVDFIIPAQNINKFLEFLTQELLKKQDYTELRQSAVERAIQYRLLTHLLTMERALGISAVYSSRPAQKPYKGPTCFASNMKLLLPILLTLMAESETTEKQWQQFNDGLKEVILQEMAKAKVPMSVPTEDKNLLSAPMPVIKRAYKLVTTLIRWREINYFEPELDAEIKGKEATREHVLAHSYQRLQLGYSLFKPPALPSLNGQPPESNTLN